MKSVLHRVVGTGQLLVVSILSFVILDGCATTKMIPGTHIPDTIQNRKIVKVVEKYRRAMSKLDMGTLMAMAHPHYYEHMGSHKGKDDFGYRGLLGVIRARLKLLQTVRYNIKYRKIKWVSKTQVEVEIYIDASFQISMSKKNTSWTRYADYNKVVLTRHKGRWLFLSGM